jgi:hypothetical protein
MFYSSTISEHLSRGVLGFGSVLLGLTYMTHGTLSGFLVSIPLLSFSLYVLRGCPACWTLGLIQTISRHLAGRKRTQELLGEMAVCKAGGCPWQ